MITNPHTVGWVNPVNGTNQAGQTVAWDPTQDLAAIEIEFDSAPAVSVPVALGATKFDITTLAAYQSLPSGQHTIALAVVTKEGAVSGFAPAQAFQAAVVPLAPTNIVLA